MATWILVPTDFICFRERLDFVGHLMNYFYAKFGHPVLVVNFTGEQFNLCFYDGFARADAPVLGLADGRPGMSEEALTDSSTFFETFTYEEARACSLRPSRTRRP